MIFDSEYELNNDDKTVIYDEVKNDMLRLFNRAYEEINASKNINAYPLSVCFDLAINNDYTETPELNDEIFNRVAKRILNSSDPTFERLVSFFDENRLIRNQEDLRLWKKLDVDIQDEIRRINIDYDQERNR